MSYIEFKYSSTEEELLRTVNSQASKGVKKFNDKLIRAHDVEGFYQVPKARFDQDQVGDTVDPSAYLETIKKSRWYGPYGRYDSQFVFFTIDNTGESEYHLSLEVCLPFEHLDESFWLRYMKNSCQIRPLRLI